jgi:hypothetical protein
MSSADDNRENYCNVIQRKAPLFALYDKHTVTLNYLKNILKASTQQGDGFKEGNKELLHPLRTTNMDTNALTQSPLQQRKYFQEN